MPGPINSFHGEYRFLSNFYELPVQITYNGVSYKTSEHAYQAQKTLDQSKRQSIANLYTPGGAKRAGGNVPLREDWSDDLAREIMAEVIEVKFQIPELRGMLSDTGDRYLIEGNYWCDNRWGVCYCSECEGELGMNWLGGLLMMERARGN